MARKKQKTKKPIKVSRIRIDVARALVVLAALSVVGFASAAVPLHSAPVPPKAAPAKHTSELSHPKVAFKYVPPQITPKPPPPTPPPEPSAKPSPSAATKSISANPSAPKIEPVVTPSPASSVDTLKPVAPTSAPPPSSPTSPSSQPPATTSSYTSTNWSGYFASGDTYTGISGSWTATSPTGNGTSTSADSTWIGIGGVTSGDLIQVGTQNIVTADGKVTAEPFFELLPDYSQPVAGVSIAPGDAITASISKLSGNQWNITITDTTNGQTNSQTFTYNSSFSSAEWIQEDPSYANNQLIPFDYYGSTAFTGGRTTTTSGAKNISESGAQPITMVNSAGQTLSIPSVLSANGSGFSVRRDNSH